MAPRPLPQSWSSPSPPNHSTLHRHTTMAPIIGTTSTPPKLVDPPNHSTLQWHPAMAPRPLPQSWPSPCPPHRALQWHPAMAPRPLPKLAVTSPLHTLQQHPAAARPLHPAMAPWCHVQSAKVVRRPPPLLEVRTPIAIAIWGTISIVEVVPNNSKKQFKSPYKKIPPSKMDFFRGYSPQN